MRVNSLRLKMGIVTPPSMKSCFYIQCSKQSKVYSTIMTLKSPSAKPSGHWSMGLFASMEDPELRVLADNKAIVIKDKYPKAKYHFLVLPKAKIPNLKSLNRTHLDLLHYVHKMGEDIALRANKELKFRLGYHAQPSMSQIHMHVISQDFDSPFLKTKKHWNSFTTSFFIDSSEVIQQLEKNGRVEEIERAEAEALLKQDLRCHVCRKTFTTIPALKAHIVLHDVTKKDKS